MTKPLETNNLGNTQNENNGFHADFRESIGTVKLDSVLKAWANRNEFLTKLEVLRTTTTPLKSTEEVKESIDTMNRLINGSGLSDNDKCTLMDCIKLVSQVFDNYGLAYALDFVHRNMEYALDEELERMKIEELSISSTN